jgi:D-sedoheptulose 7-phosphate isomerase
MAAAATAPAAATRFTGPGISRPAGRRKGGKFLVQLAGAAMRTFRPAPVRRADKDFAVAPAFLAMKLVDWHGVKIVYSGKFSSGLISPFLPVASIYAPGMSHLQRAIEESTATLRSLSALEEPLNRAAELILRSLTSGKKLLVCGNGGSASDATHLATEFLCRFKDDRRPYPALSLTANGEFMTAVCNDYHADEIFARQVWGLADKGDVLIVITTSGKSKNVARAGGGQKERRREHRHSRPRRRLHQGNHND